jgi:hypothetical protein
MQFHFFILPGKYTQHCTTVVILSNRYILTLQLSSSTTQQRKQSAFAHLLIFNFKINTPINLNLTRAGKVLFTLRNHSQGSS